MTDMGKLNKEYEIGDLFVNVASTGNLSELTTLYHQIPDDIKLDIVHHAGNKALRVAARNKHLGCVRFLIEECQADIHAWTDCDDKISIIRSRDAPIRSACINDDLPMIDYLLSKHPEKLCTDHEKENTTSDLYSAVKRGSIEVIKRLLQHGETEQNPLFCIYYGTPNECFIPIFQFFIEELKYQPSLEEWNHIFKSSIGHNYLPAIQWIWNNCPCREELDLQKAMGQAIYGVIDNNPPYPIIVYLRNTCQAKLTYKDLLDGFNSSRVIKGQIVDRTPFFQWLESIGVDVKHPSIIQKARNSRHVLLTQWLTNS